MDVFSVEVIFTSFLIFVRVTSVLMTAPFFSFQIIPSRIIIFFGILLTIALFPVIPAQHAHIPSNPGNLEVALYVGIEILVGAMMGLAGKIILSGIQMGAQLLSINIGLSFATIIDPLTQNKNGVIGRMFVLLAILVFLSIGGAHMYIKILAYSFEEVPLGMASISQASPVLIDMAVYMFKVGVQLASPFIVVLFLLDLSFAIFARIMPQANIFFIALPLKLGIGMLMLLLIVPYLPITFANFFEELWQFISTLLAAV